MKCRDFFTLFVRGMHGGAAVLLGSSVQDMAVVTLHGVPVGFY